MSFAVSDLDERFKHAFDTERLGFPEGQALTLLRFESDIPSIAVLIVQRLQARVVETTDFLQRFGDCGATKSELKVDVGWGDGVCGKPDL